MKCDWSYITKDRAKMNIALVATEVINSMAESGEADQILGVCKLMNALKASLEDEEDE